MTSDKRRKRLRYFFRHNPFYQFGQPYSTTKSTQYGSEGCTHTNIQALVKLWKGKDITHDEISRLCGYRAGQGGLTPVHLEILFKKLDLPYKMVYGLDAAEVLDYAMDRGPVLIATYYLFHPEMKDAKYLGTKADGKPNGYSRPLGSAGKDQLTGFTGGHSEILFAGRDRSDGIRDAYVHDPNHRSNLRPQEVPFDIMTLAQLRQMFNGYAIINRARRTVAAIPTEAYNG